MVAASRLFDLTKYLSKCITFASSITVIAIPHFNLTDKMWF